jgi:two-component system, OmpR family, response regulator
MPHILFVEDDAEISRLVGRYLRAADFRVSVLPDGKKIERALEDNRVDLILLDLMLPGEDGLSLCRRLRTHSRVPIIMVTAKGDELDRILGLEMGADDYLAKPFNPRELLARIRAVLRRTGAAAPVAELARHFAFCGWRVDCLVRELTDPNGTRITLTSAEFDLLQVLCERAGRVLSRDQLLDLTHGRSADSLGRSVDVLISRLRRKIERDPHDPGIIKTVRSGGYLFVAKVEAA